MKAQQPVIRLADREYIDAGETARFRPEEEIPHHGNQPFENFHAQGKRANIFRRLPDESGY